MKSASQAAQNWANSAPRAQQAYQSGVESYNGDWAGATIQQIPTMQANFNAAVAAGRVSQGIQNVGTGGWKSATVAKMANYATGFQAGAARQSASIAKILSAEANIVGSLPPRGSYAQNVARATAVMDGLHALKGTLGA